MKKYYKILGIEEGASQEEIKEAYNRFELDFANKDNEDFFKDEYQKVKAAYKALYNTSNLGIEKIIENEHVKNSNEINEFPQYSRGQFGQIDIIKKASILKWGLISMVSIAVGGSFVYLSIFPLKHNKTNEIRHKKKVIPVVEEAIKFGKKPVPAFKYKITTLNKRYSTKILPKVYKKYLENWRYATELISLGDYTGAMRIYDNTLQFDLDKDNASYLYERRANLKALLKDFRGAIYDCSIALKLTPDYTMAYYARGSYKETIGDLNGACIDWVIADNNGYFDYGDKSEQKRIRNLCN